MQKNITEIQSISKGSHWRKLKPRKPMYSDMSSVKCNFISWRFCREWLLTVLWTDFYWLTHITLWQPSAPHWVRWVYSDTNSNERIFSKLINLCLDVFLTHSSQLLVKLGRYFMGTQVLHSLGGENVTSNSGFSPTSKNFLYKSPLVLPGTVPPGCTWLKCCSEWPRPPPSASATSLVCSSQATWVFLWEKPTKKIFKANKNVQMRNQQFNQHISNVTLKSTYFFLVPLH